MRQRYSFNVSDQLLISRLVVTVETGKSQNILSATSRLVSSTAVEWQKQVTSGEGVEAKVKAKATICCPQAVLEVEDSSKTPSLKRTLLLLLLLF